MGVLGCGLGGVVVELARRPQLGVIIATVGTAMTVAAKPELSAASEARFLGSAIGRACAASRCGLAIITADFGDIHLVALKVALNLLVALHAFSRHRH